MLKDKVKQHIEEIMKTVDAQQKSGDSGIIEVAMYKEEMDYGRTHGILPEDTKETINIVEQNPVFRFSEAYVERVDKESEQVIAEEVPTIFLNRPVKYLEEHKNEFIYLESQWFEMLGVDAVSIEVDDVFGFYDVMLGLKQQKKFEAAIKTYLSNNLQGSESKFDLMFNHSDGLWDLNFVLNYVDGFKEDMSIGEVYSLIYHFLFKLVEAVEEK